MDIYQHITFWHDCCQQRTQIHLLVEFKPRNYALVSTRDLPRDGDELTAWIGDATVAEHALALTLARAEHG
jgi:hypothetical protein